MFASINVQSTIFARGFKERSIPHVVFNQFADLDLSLYGIQCFRRALDWVADPVELGGMAASPQSMQRDSVTTLVRTGKLFRNDDKGTSGSREATVLGEGTELNRAFPGAFDLVNRTRKSRVL